ncbi:MAG: hypothetical protein ACK8QZ_02400 [Anaerolineales bacterium]
MRTILLAVFLFPFLLSACGSSPSATDPAARAVEQYITALVEKNAERLSALSCADWEANALMELDSFQAVQTRVEALQCQTVSTEGTTRLVQCQGKIFATYGNEEQSLDLSLRAYQVIQQGSDYLVCGYR